MRYGSEIQWIHWKIAVTPEKIAQQQYWNFL
jgi:hypothetical protein